jgi:hypothetical protein
MQQRLLANVRSDPGVLWTGSPALLTPSGLAARLRRALELADVGVGAVCGRP